MDRRDKFVSRNGDDGERALPRAGERIPPVFPDTGDAEELAV
jgi:hypothetical protein